MADYVTLANQEGSFFDPETGFGLSRDDVKELTQPVGRLTKERLRFGGIVRCAPPQSVGADPSVCPDEPGTPEAAEAIEEPEAPVPDVATEPESRESFLARTAKQINSKFTMAELREACKRHGIDVPKRPKAETLAKLIAQAEWEQQQG
jgi:hypothetical protein